MSVFDRFENAVEKGVSDAFSRVFRSGVKPVDISSQVRRAMDDNIAEISSDHSVAPNDFSVIFAPSDLEEIHNLDSQLLAEEIANDATRHARDQRYTLVGPVIITFEESASQLAGTMKVHATTKRGAAAPATAGIASPTNPIIDIDGDCWLLTEPVTVIGRGAEANIVVPDTGVSRTHLELRVTPSGVIATDLGSTNGTYVEGHRIDAATLVDGNQITIGRTRILFWTSPEDGTR